MPNSGNQDQYRVISLHSPLLGRPLVIMATRWPLASFPTLLLASLTLWPPNSTRPFVSDIRYICGSIVRPSKYGLKLKVGGPSRFGDKGMGALQRIVEWIRGRGGFPTGQAWETFDLGARPLQASQIRRSCYPEGLLDSHVKPYIEGLLHIAFTCRIIRWLRCENNDGYYANNRA